jgi:Alginate export
LGRTPYELGHGMLLADGAGDGGSRGGFWSGARKAWEYAGVVRLSNDQHALELFYLDRDELPEADTDSKLAGANYELTLGEHTTLGVSYLTADSDEPLRDGMDVYNARAFTAPLKSLPGLSFELEYAYEENADDLAATAWSAQVGYTLSNVGWTPRLSYRYAFFEGDDPDTARSESFDMLFPGFHDWGTWWQGEIGGEYFLANSNLISHQVRLHLEPRAGIGAGLIAYLFELDHPSSFATGVISKDVAAEIDGYLDWEINDNFTASVVLAYAEPDDAIEQGFGRTESLSYGMVYLSYSY